MQQIPATAALQGALQKAYLLSYNTALTLAWQEAEMLDRRSDWTASLMPALLPVLQGIRAVAHNDQHCEEQRQHSRRVAGSAAAADGCSGGGGAGGAALSHGPGAVPRGDHRCAL